MKTYRIIIANEASNFTSTKYNTTLNGFTSEEAASKAAKQALRDAAGELMKWDAICYIETLNAWVLANNGNWLLVAKVEEAPETPNPEPDNTPNVSDLARWIDLQLSTIIEGVSAGYTLGNYNSVWIDKGATVFNVSLANGETVEIDSDNYNTAEEIATAIISTLNNNHLKHTTMKANNISTAIIAELEARKDRSAWSKAVTDYAIKLAESLDDWGKQPVNVSELEEMLLNGAADWKRYSWGGCSLVYNQDIAERVCSPSELKRVTNKSGLRDMPNAYEHWLDIQARALYQASRRVVDIAAKYLNA